jgi:hypothetical protein
MFKSLEELQQFIIWARHQKVKSFKVGSDEVILSDYAFVEDLVSPQKAMPQQTDGATEPIIPVPTEDDPDLYHSSGM